MGLKPLEFADCLLDSPYFRENIHEHERELEQTNEAIKGLIKECKALLKATEILSKAQQSFAQVLDNFRFECIGEVETDDEIRIADALKEFAKVIKGVEEERITMIVHANDQLIQSLENFRKEQIEGAKEEKKKFDKQTEKFCLTVQSYLNMSSKKKETQLTEADTQFENERGVFHQTALDYVFKLQEVNETKKFQFVETLLSYMYAQKTFFHTGYEVYYIDKEGYMTDLQLRLQNTRDRFSATKEQAETLMNKVQQKAKRGELYHQGAHTGQGYLNVQEKRKGGLGYTWTKHYCYYTKENKILTMIPYVQTQGRMNACTDTMVITSCIRKKTDSIDRRFCFDITAQDRPGTITLQCLNKEDRKLWLEAMDGKEPEYLDSNQLPIMDDAEKTEIGLEFIKKAIAAIEKRGITDQGLYRVVGVDSNVQNMILQCIKKKKIYAIDLESEDCEFEVKTITSALKQHIRNMCPPVFTFDYHDDFLNAVKLETYKKRIEQLKKLIQGLPEHNRNLIFQIMTHLKRVAAHSNKNLMAASNLGVVFGPTLMKSKEETMAAIMNLKHQSVVVELLIKEYDYIFDVPKEEEINNIQNSQNSKQNAVERPILPPKKPMGKRSTNDGPDGNCIDGKPPASAKAYRPPRPPNRPAHLSRRKQVPSTDSEEDDSSSKSGSSGSLQTARGDQGRSSSVSVNLKKDKIGSLQTATGDQGRSSSVSVNLKKDKKGSLQTARGDQGRSSSVSVNLKKDKKEKPSIPPKKGDLV